jgi:hypothetical protein
VVRVCNLLLAAVVAGGLLATACGDTSGGPSGPPPQVVGRAPDATLAEGTARVKINSPTANALGVVDLRSRSGTLTVLDPALQKPADLLIVSESGWLRPQHSASWGPLGGPLPEQLRGGDPFANLDLLRGTVHILSDGGAEVEGASTIGYTVDVDPAVAVAMTPPDRRPALLAVLSGRTAVFQMQVWIDSLDRVRRVQVPTELQLTTPPTRVDRLPIATDVDYLAFAVPVPAVQAPETGA